MEEGSEAVRGGLRMRRQLDTLGGAHVPYGSNGHKVYKGGKWRKDRNEFLSEEDDIETLALTLDESDDLEGYSSYTRPYLYGLAVDQQREPGERNPFTTVSRARRHGQSIPIDRLHGDRYIDRNQRRKRRNNGEGDVEVTPSAAAGGKGKTVQGQGRRKGKGKGAQAIRGSSVNDYAEAKNHNTNNNPGNAANGHQGASQQ